MRTHLRTPLYANAYLLILNQIFSAGLGILYWMLAARFYSADIVGRSSAVISTVTFLAVLAELSLKSAMVRFVPRAGKLLPRLILYTYAINLSIAVIVSVLFFTVGSSLQFTAQLTGGDSSIGLVWLILATMTWTIFYVQDGVLTGMRRAFWVLTENTFYNIAKIVLLVVGVWVFFDNGIVASWFLPVPLVVILVTGLIFMRFLPRFLQNAPTGEPITARQVVTSVTGDHIGTLLAETSVKLLPLMVVNLLGKSENAYFYQAWLVSNTLALIAYNMASSFTVEASADRVRIAYYSRKILLHMARIIVPMVIGLLVLSQWVLALFGAEYALQGAPLLRWLTLAALPMILNIWFLSYARVQGKVGWIILAQGMQCVLTLGISFLLMPQMGIVGVGIAWLTAQTAIAAVVLSLTLPMLLRKDASGVTDKAGFTQTWRRADWRFLTQRPWQARTLLFSDTFSCHDCMPDALKHISQNVIHAASMGPFPDRFDLAVAAQPSWAVCQAAFQSLSRDGAFYSEWVGWRSGGVNGIRRRIRSAGFVDLRLYWVYPSPQFPRVWIPCDAAEQPAALIARRLFYQNTRLHHLLRKLLTTFIRVMASSGFAPHISAIARKTHLPGSTYFVDQIQTICDSPPSSAVMLQTGGSQVHNKIIALCFEVGQAEPTRVFKIPRTQADVLTLQNEVNILRRLASVGIGQKSVDTPPVKIPHILLAEYLGPSWVACQSAIHGMPIYHQKTLAQFRVLADHLTDFQIQLAQQTRAARAPQGFTEELERLFAHLEKIPEEALALPEREMAHQALMSLVDLPLVCAQYDFAPWNVFQNEQTLGVFDWSDACWDGLPMVDLTFMLTYLCPDWQNVHSPEQAAETYQALLDPTQAAGEIFYASLERYTRSLGIPEHSIPALRLLTWVFHSSSQAENFQQNYDEHVPVQEYVASLVISLLKKELQLQQDHSSEA